MKIEQIYTGCLSEAAYYIESDGQAAIIDPLREVAPYLEKAKTNHSQIKYVFETHFHADFVSGHLDLAQKTGAKIVFGPTASPNYEVYIAQDNETFDLGKIKIKVLHTPGHTLESTTYLLTDEEGKEKALFTGDTLFIGDVGRPDLAVKSNVTKEDLAGMLYDSLRKKILPLPDSVMVYPAHGAGSACGKNMSKETYDTLGNQKRYNYALKSDITKEEFIKEVTTGLAAPPQYFPKNVALNQNGYESIDTVINRGVKPLTIEEFLTLSNDPSTLILDTRKKEKVFEGFLPDSLWIGLEGKFASWVGTLIQDLKTPLLYIADEGTEEEVVTRLARVGYDNPLGYLKGGLDTWVQAGKNIETLENIDVDTFSNIYLSQTLQTLDVRNQVEFNNGHLEKAQNFPLDSLAEQAHSLDKNAQYFVHCQGGYRSVIAASILKKRGIKNLVNIDKGYNGIKKTKLALTPSHN